MRSIISTFRRMVTLFSALALFTGSRAKVSFEWTRVNFDAKDRYDVPVRRSDAAMWELNGVIYLFGGFIADASTALSLDDFWRLDGIASGSPKWTLLSSGPDFWSYLSQYNRTITVTESAPGKPVFKIEKTSFSDGDEIFIRLAEYAEKIQSYKLLPPRDGAVSFVYNGRLYLYGGWGLDYDMTSSATNSDVWMYTPATGAWEFLAGYKSNLIFDEILRNNQPRSSMIAPLGRYLAAHFLDETKGKLYISGGSADGVAQFSDLWEYDIRSRRFRWISGTNLTTSEVTSYGNLPYGRFASLFWKSGEDEGRMFGGYGTGNLYPEWSGLDGRVTLNEMVGVSLSTGQMASLSKPKVDTFGEVGDIGSIADGCAWKMKDKAYLFGGRARPPNDPAGYSEALFGGPTNDIWSVAPNSNIPKFENGSLTGYDNGTTLGFPRARFAHKCVHVPNTDTVIVFGGVANEDYGYPREADEVYIGGYVGDNGGPLLDLGADPYGDLFIDGPLPNDVPLPIDDPYSWDPSQDTSLFDEVPRRDPYYLNDMWILRVIDSENPLPSAFSSNGDTRVPTIIAPPTGTTEEQDPSPTNTRNTKKDTESDGSINILGMQLSQGAFVGALLGIVAVVIGVGVLVANYVLRKNAKANMNAPITSTSGNVLSAPYSPYGKTPSSPIVMMAYSPELGKMIPVLASPYPSTHNSRGSNTITRSKGTDPTTTSQTALTAPNASSMYALNQGYGSEMSLHGGMAISPSAVGGKNSGVILKMPPTPNGYVNQAAPGKSSSSNTDRSRTLHNGVNNNV